jgi:uncharacterized protein (TIGR04255 family)
VPQISVQLLDGPPMPRFLLISEDDTELVQVQHDLFALNWRRVEGAGYPEYDQLRADFVRQLDAFQGLLMEKDKGKLRPNWCEVTYVNHIDAAHSGRKLQLGEILTLVQDPTHDGALPPQEDVQVGARYLLDEDERPIGRLLVNAAPAVRTADQVPIWVLNLTTRLRVDDQSLDGALGRLDVGHEWADRAFVALTTPRMHEIWGYGGAD